ncbi:uncharacterized protein BJ212DRAFT_1298920 [Suillus subaureus]|uniref:Uncharacterized protein n=1 Tax=Suillus subaureus TaxID=48587 RepID=A0A9P7ECY0_9AGAM|nr:uncharacterized protein BJ212DRAFT_1298920 [Suillus subaureus]KAG1818070.1 hypothetical protein BJ212DRAFT_1298920 [Suillus subaureus]
MERELEKVLEDIQQMDPGEEDMDFNMGDPDMDFNEDMMDDGTPADVIPPGLDNEDFFMSNDIFDGDMCHLKLKASDGSLFFSNGPNECQGPDKELHIGVNLGVDWSILAHLWLCVSISYDSGSTASRYQQNLVQKCKLGEKYQQLTTPTTCKNFVKDYATCYTQLSRLPYFNLVNQVVIDPMHNLFLGLIKMHFYNIWVQGKVLHPNHELTTFHNMLANFTLPSACRKLPKDIGMPSGGLFTVDQWLLLSTVYGPIVIPQLWSTCLPSCDSDQILQDCVAQIKQLETKKACQAEKKFANHMTLEAAKKQGKEAHILERAHIAKEKELEVADKNDARLKAAATKQAEKA